MLIRSIRAENFMRFSRLDISELPSKGIIGIEGPNESGKSTVGEALLFGFFGKTRYSSEAPVTSLIRWGADLMSVEVEFSIRASGGADGAPSRSEGDFLLFRQIDRHGTNYVKLLELPSRNELATGNYQVAEFISKRVRFDFLEFQQSFYRDQYESRKTQVEQALFFESATGVAHLQQTIVELGNEVGPLETEFSFYQKEIARNLVQIEQYGRNVSKIPELALRVAKIPESIEESSARVGELRRQADLLRSEAAKLEARGKLLEKLLGNRFESLPDVLEKILGYHVSPKLLDDGVENGLHSSQERLQKLQGFFADLMGLRSQIQKGHQEAVRQLDESLLDGPVVAKARLDEEGAKHGRKARRSSVLGFLGLVLAATAGWLFLAVPADRLGDLVPDTWRPHTPWILGGSTAILFLVALVLLGRALLLRIRRGRAQSRSVELNTKILNLHEIESELRPVLETQGARDTATFIASAEGCSIPDVVKAANDLRTKHRVLLQGEGRKGKGHGGLEKAVSSLSQADRDLRSRILGEVGKLEKTQSEEEGVLKKVKSERDRVEAEVRECKSQATRKEDLEEKNRELEASGAEIREEIDARLLARRLTEETIYSVRSKIGPSLTRFVKSILPRLTAGRYRDVRVEDDLEIKVFSSEKNDFLALHELSGGTNEALLLALRLAISHSFVSSRVRQEQFVFLDESFQMMDPEKVALTLQLLPLLSPDLEQFFVVQTKFSEKQLELLDKLLRTSVGATELSVSCGSSVSGDKSRSASRPTGLGRAGQDPSPHVVEA